MGRPFQYLAFIVNFDVLGGIHADHKRAEKPMPVVFRLRKMCTTRNQRKLYSRCVEIVVGESARMAFEEHGLNKAWVK